MTAFIRCAYDNGVISVSNLMTLFKILRHHCHMMRWVAVHSSYSKYNADARAKKKRI